ncbi:MAG: cellulase family glycosylhydrolase, partial [Clostridia bacterium]|nr:cellulase family glycosylhydrolase [Clostridia bacterium]
GGVSWQQVKSYAEEVIAVIRENDEDAVIIVGTPNWSQYVDQAAADPITTSDNIMYALHFYAATHTDDLRNKMKNAVNNGLPVFVSEYGICDASGNGGINYDQANKWVKAMDDLGISYIAWNLSNKNETSAILKSSCNKTSGFGQNDLSDSGKWLYETLTGRTVTDFTPSNTGDKQQNNQGSAQQGGNNQQAAPTPTQAPTANISTGEGLAIVAEARDSWESPEGKNCNYSLTITNNSGKDVDGWKISLNFTENITAVQGWSGNFTIEGKTLHISNVDYNGRIANGESIKDIGFIITGGSNIQIVG